MSVLVSGLSAFPSMSGISVLIISLSTPLSLSNISMSLLRSSVFLTVFTMFVPGLWSSPSPFFTQFYLQTSTPILERKRLGQ